MRDQRSRPDPTEEVGEIYQTGIKPGAVTLTQHLPVQRKAKPEARHTPTPEAPSPDGFGFIQAYGGEIQKKGDASFPDERPTSWMGGSGGGAPLPAPVQAKMEHAFSADLSSVRVHEGSAAGELGAQAFAQGTDIHFAPGRYDPHSTAGQELLGHEIAHVVQQSQGRVSSTHQAKGGAAINADPALEREADDMGARAARGERVGTRVDGPLASTAVRQLKREPISAGGMNIVTLARQFFAKAKDPSVDKSALTLLGTQITQAASTLDASKETNQDFLYVLNVFKSGLHDRTGEGAERLRGEVEKKFNFLADEITEEGKNEVTAKQLELAEGGHALDRHGPAVSDEALIRRLHTGIAPDNALVPAPGASSRFNSHTDYLETRQKAAALLQQEILGAAGKVITWLSSVGGLTGVHAAAQLNTAAKVLALATATTEKTDAFKPTSGLDKTQKEAKLNAFKQAGTDKKDAEGAEKTAKDEMDHPGKNLKRLLPGLTKVKLNIDDDVDDAASLEDGVTLVDSYGINAEHGKPIGTAFTSDQSIKLSDILSKVSTGDPPQPKPPGEITNALTAEGFAGDLPAFVAFLSDPANLLDVKKRGEKGAKIYKTATSSGPLTMSYTLLKSGTTKLFDPTGQPLAIDTAGWQAIQHFPAPPGSVAGVEA